MTDVDGVPELGERVLDQAGKTLDLLPGRTSALRDILALPIVKYYRSYRTTM